MNDFRFRAWINKLNCYADQVEIYGNGGFWAWKDKEKYADAELEQWTGLCDKNNRPIYEGDIVRCHAYHRVDIEPVKWNDQVCGFDPMATPCDYDAAYYGECEIIGNIHDPKE